MNRKEEIKKKGEIQKKSRLSSVSCPFSVSDEQHSDTKNAPVTTVIRFN